MTLRIEPSNLMSELNDVDSEIIQLLQRRRGLSQSLPPGSSDPRGNGYPASFEVDRVVRQFVEELGPPGELVARSMLNICRLG